MFLGIEIGGTKLQLGVGQAVDRELVVLKRAEIRPAAGAQGILQQIEQLARPLIADYRIKAAGFGFGGPVDVRQGRVIRSHHVSGWENFPLATWCQETLNIPAAVGNDSDLAGLGEACFGAGQGHRVVFYTNVGSGIGGALIISGKVYMGGAGIASEIGHLRPGLEAQTPQQIVELSASGWAIAEAAKNHPELAHELQKKYNCLPTEITGKMVAEAALSGNQQAREIFHRATKTYGWAIAQAITLLAPEIIVVGGGVSLVGETLFFTPLREEVARYVFPPLRETYKIVPAGLGEEVVIHGALVLARNRAETGEINNIYIP